MNDIQVGTPEDDVCDDHTVDVRCPYCQIDDLETELKELKAELYGAFQYAYGYRQHPSMRGSSLAAAWTSYKEYQKS